LEDEIMFVVERLIAAAALFVAAHFAMGFLNPSAGGTGGALIFPFASNAGSRWSLVPSTPGRSSWSSR
jgi:hypothetical protein